jgi:hypothetical protein
LFEIEAGFVVVMGRLQGVFGLDVRSVFAK